MKRLRLLLLLLLICIFRVTAYAAPIPEYSGEPYAVINENIPYFETVHISGDGDIYLWETEFYSELDALGRCGPAFATVCVTLMPEGGRGDISGIKPTGWHSVKYDSVSGKYLYNRCHLIGWQLAGENANGKNLITGTRYLNVTGMLPFENMVADYVRETRGHVLYRATPDFEGDDLVARGVLLEAWSVEDNGEGVCFNVYCYNVQPGIRIDYALGISMEE